MQQQKELIKSLAIEAIYSAKGHFKTSDWIGYYLFLLVAVPFITSAIILVFPLPDFWIKFCSFIGLVFSLLSLVYAYASNQIEAKKQIETHMNIGNDYLSCFKQLRNMFFLNSISKDQIETVSKEIQSLDKKSQTCKISAIARIHAKLTIKGEVDGWPFIQN